MDRNQELINAFIPETTESACIVFVSAFVYVLYYYCDWSHHGIQQIIIELFIRSYQILFCNHLKSKFHEDFGEILLRIIYMFWNNGQISSWAADIIEILQFYRSANRRLNMNISTLFKDIICKANNKLYCTFLFFFTFLYSLLSKSTHCILQQKSTVKFLHVL